MIDPLLEETGDLSEWLRRMTRNHLGSPAQVRVLRSSLLAFLSCHVLIFFKAFVEFEESIVTSLIPFQPALKERLRQDASSLLIELALRTD